MLKGAFVPGEQHSILGGGGINIFLFKGEELELGPYDARVFSIWMQLQSEFQ